MFDRRNRTSASVAALFPAVLLLLLGVVASRAYAVDDFTVSFWGDGAQIWWQAEDFDQRIPDTDDHFALELPPIGEEAFGKDELNTINRIGAGGRISYTFDLTGIGEGGEWYFWGRVLNPNNLSDYMVVEGHPGDVIPTTEPFSFGGADRQRIFERNTGPPFGWSGGAEGHIKQLQDGENTMHIVHRQADNRVFWDVMMWTDDPDYVPTDVDFLDSGPFVPILLPGDFNGDSTVDIADYQILLSNFNNDVERGMDGDITLNGHVNFKDFVSFRAAFEAQPAGAAAVPEPTSFFLLGAGALLLGGLRRRRVRSVESQTHPRTRGFGFFVVAFVASMLFQATTPSQTWAQEIIIPQKPGSDFIAFEAEDFFDLNNGDDASGWGKVDTIEPYRSPATVGPASLVLDERSNAGRGEAVFDFPGGNVNDFIRWRLEFVEDGDYSLYIRYSLFNIQGDAGYGNEDSIYVSSEFGLDGILVDTEADPRGARDAMPSFYGVFPKGASRQEGNFDWWNASADGSDPTAENPDAVFFPPELNTEVDFGIAARERGVALDKIVFHTNDSLSAAELDALPTYDPFVDIPGDFNEDGEINAADFTLMVDNFSLKFPVSESHAKGDITRNGIVDLADFLDFRQIFNAPAGAAAVPEPTGLIIVLPLAWLLALRRKRRH